MKNLKKPSISDRIRINDIAEVSWKDGEMIIKNSFRALAEWAAAGLECTIAELEKYSDEEIKEIGAEVKELATLKKKKG